MKTCVHTWSDRDWRGRRMDDGVLCAKCGRLSHWYRIVREQAKRIAELEALLARWLGRGRGGGPDLWSDTMDALKERP